MTEWLSQNVSPITDGLSQFGAIGILASICITAAVVLFRQQVRNHEIERAQFKETLEAERKRGDRLEQELRDLHAITRDKVVPALTESTAVVSRALSLREGKNV